MPSKGKTPNTPPAKPGAKRSRRTAQPRYAEAAQLRSEILAYRTLGLTLDEIAARVNRSKSVVHTHLTHALQELDEEQKEASDRLRALAYARLEKVLARAMLGAIKGDVKCMREVQRLIGQQGRLMGWGNFAKVNPETGVPLGEGGDGVPPGHWTLPMRPTVDLGAWQEQAEKVWHEQQARAGKAG
ncbi:terminase small subunit [Stenotrophomonas phage Suso]|nr:terminase small subunit [Stenotrophomonas phage Suso]